MKEGLNQKLARTLSSRARSFVLVCKEASRSWLFTIEYSFLLLSHLPAPANFLVNVKKCSVSMMTITDNTVLSASLH